MSPILSKAPATDNGSRTLDEQKADLARCSKREEVLALMAGKRVTDITAISARLDELAPPAKVIVSASPFPNSDAFLKTAADVSANALAFTVSPKKFSTGSYGWSYNGKLNVSLPDGKLVRVQASVNLVVIGSKPE